MSPASRRRLHGHRRGCGQRSNRRNARRDDRDGDATLGHRHLAVGCRGAQRDVIITRGQRLWNENESTGGIRYRSHEPDRRPAVRSRRSPRRDPRSQPRRSARPAQRRMPGAESALAGGNGVDGASRSPRSLIALLASVMTLAAGFSVAGADTRGFDWSAGALLAVGVREL